MGNFNLAEACRFNEKISGVIYNHMSEPIMYSITTRQIMMNVKHVKMNRNIGVGAGLNKIELGAGNVNEEQMSYQFQTNQATYTIQPRGNSQLGLKKIDPSGFISLWILDEDGDIQRFIVQNMPIRGRDDINMAIRLDGSIQHIDLDRQKDKCPNNHNLTLTQDNCYFVCDLCHQQVKRQRTNRCVRCDFDVCLACLPIVETPKNET